MKFITTNKAYVQTFYHVNLGDFAGFCDLSKTEKTLRTDKIDDIFSLKEIGYENSETFAVGYNSLFGFHYIFIDGDMIKFSEMLNVGGVF